MIARQWVVVCYAVANRLLLVPGAIVALLDLAVVLLGRPGGNPGHCEDGRPHDQPRDAQAHLRVGEDGGDQDAHVDEAEKCQEDVKVPATLVAIPTISI